MNKIIYPSQISGNIQSPSSKSMMQRALCAALLSNGNSIIKNPTWCNDALAAKSLSENLGAEIQYHENEVLIKGGLNLKNNILNCNESGLAIRMFTPVAALFNHEITISGHGSLLKRPMNMLEEPLKSLGVQIESNNGYLPLKIKGKLKGGFAKVDGSVSSQVLTGLLMALPLAENDSELEVTDLQSKPYIDMTLELLNIFGISIVNENYQKFKIKGNQQYKACEYTIEGDWSNTAFLLVAGAIGGELIVNGLNPKSKQADVNILNAFHQCNAKLSINQDFIKTSKSNLHGFYFDATHCPDLFPPLVALASNCSGISVIRGTNRLIYKESNRAIVLQNEFEKIGIKITLQPNEMVIYGSKIVGGTASSNNDHRIAMALALAGINAENPVVIENSEAVNKSYPEFFDDFIKIGGKIK